MTFPFSSTATHRETVGQESPAGCAKEVSIEAAVQVGLPLPGLVDVSTSLLSRLTAAQKDVVGHEIAKMFESPKPLASLTLVLVHG